MPFFEKALKFYPMKGIEGVEQEKKEEDVVLYCDIEGEALVEVLPMRRVADGIKDQLICSPKSCENGKPVEIDPKHLEENCHGGKEAEYDKDVYPSIIQPLKLGFCKMDEEGEEDKSAVLEDGDRLYGIVDLIGRLMGKEKHACAKKDCCGNP